MRVFYRCEALRACTHFNIEILIAQKEIENTFWWNSWHSEAIRKSKQSLPSQGDVIITFFFSSVAVAMDGGGGRPPNVVVFWREFFFKAPRRLKLTINYHYIFTQHLSVRN